MKELASVPPVVIAVEGKGEAGRDSATAETELHEEPAPQAHVQSAPSNGTAPVRRSREAEGAVEAIEKIGYEKKEARELVLGNRRLCRPGAVRISSIMAQARTRLAEATGRRPAVGERLRLLIADMALDGDSIARLGSYVVFLAGGIPGEEVEAEVESAGRKFARARLLAVLKPSPHRVVPPCPYFGSCGGCSWQHIAYPEELRLKERILRSVLELVLDGPAPVEPALGLASPWGFRNKVHFVVGSDPEGRAVLGHFGARSRELVPVEECRVHDERGNRIAFRLRDLLRREEVPPVRDERPGTGIARHIVVRASGSTGETQAVLVATRRKFPGLEEIAREITSGPDRSSGFHLNTNRREGNLVLGSFTRRIAGRERLLDEVAGVRFLISAASFFQTNVMAAGKLVDLVAEAVGRRPCAVLDLYAGVGLFALPLARLGHRVVAVEENPHAVQDGIEGARFNGIRGVRFLRGRVEEEARRLARGRAFQAAVLDPPREGCSERVLRFVSRTLRPSRIVYVSCDPRALARDLRLLLAAGYSIDGVRPVDMFPHTSHIEAVARLSLGRGAGRTFSAVKRDKKWRRS